MTGTLALTGTLTGTLTLALAGTLATIATLGGAGALAGGAAAASKAGKVVTITRRAFQGTRSLFRSRKFIGKAPQHGVEKIFHAVRPVAKRFATNGKSTGLTTSLMVKVGMGLGAASLFVTAVGSYPFAGFIKEEAVQQLGFAFNSAERNDDLIGMEEALITTREIVEAETTIIDLIPYANIIKQLKVYFDAVKIKLETDNRTFEKKRLELERR